MKKKLTLILIPVIALLLIAAFFLLSIIIPEPILKNRVYKENAPIIGSVELNFGSLSTAKGDLALFRDATGKQTVYNIATGTGVYTAEADNATTVTAITLDTLQKLSYFTVTVSKNGDVESATLCDAAGQVIATTTADPDYANYSNALLTFGDNAYTVNKKGTKIEKSFEIDDFQDLSNLANATSVGREYFYFRTSSYISVVNYKGEFVASCSVDDNSTDVTCFVLENGNVVIQTVYALPDSAKDYDAMIDNGGVAEKYNIVTQILHVKRNKIKEKNVDFLITSLFNANHPNPSNTLNADFGGNYAQINRLEDERIASDSEYVLLTNGLRIRKTMEDLVVGGGMATATPIDGIYSVSDRFGYTHLLNERGKELKSFHGYPLKGMTDQYFVTSTAIYNKSFEKVYDYEKEGYDLEQCSATFVLLSKEQADGSIIYATYYNGAITTIFTEADPLTQSLNCASTWDLYYIRSGNTCTYYNGAGTLIGAYSGTLSIERRTDSGACLVSAGGKYYRLNAATVN